ncbi:MAG: histidine kinase [Crocinitomix sp.]|nr:histidine kinase [Crocinitomix sp.]
MERKTLFYWGVQFAGWTAYFLFSILLLFSTEDFISTFNLYIYAALSILAAIMVSHGIRYVIIKKSLLSKPINQLVIITLFLSIIAGFTLETFQHFFEEIIEIDFLVDQDKQDNSSQWVVVDGDTLQVANLPVDSMQINTPADTLQLTNGETLSSEQQEEEPFQWGVFLFGVSRSIILFLLWSGFYYVFAIVEKSRAQEILNLKWEASKNEIELKNLRAQLNPHFLFNSLNSIRALIGLNPEQAKTSVTQLSSLLRKSISLGKLRVISLKEELDLVKIYLDLEQVRFEERLSTDFQISQESLSLEIPPLMIQTVVENAIKHGISQSIDGGIVRVISNKRENTLEITVSNSGLLKIDQKEEGIGISNTKKRLEILYGKDASFSISQVDDEVVVKINITYK